MKRLFAVILIFFFSESLIASEFSGKIQSIATGPNLGSVVLVRVEGHSSTAPWAVSGCTDGFWSFKFDAASAGGKETYSLLLAAYASKASVVISGTGSCPTVGGVEQVQNIGYTRFAL
jgi:hypothetical protein